MYAPMIGTMRIDEPVFANETKVLVEEARERFGQSYRAVLSMGLYGMPYPFPEGRLYAGYQYLKGQPGDAAAWLEVADVHREARQIERAEAILAELERVGPGELIEEVFRENLKIHRALLAADAGRTEEALDRLAPLDTLFATHPLYRYLLATLYHALDRYAEAAAEYGAAIDLLAEAEADPDLEEEDIGFDPEAAREAVESIRATAAREEPFAGERPLSFERLVPPEDPAPGRDER
jgi:tetratricopeptide (TPR) repeat protein